MKNVSLLNGLTTHFDQPGLVDNVYGTYQFDAGVKPGANFIWQTGRPLNCFGVQPTDEFAAEYGAESFYCRGIATSRASERRLGGRLEPGLKRV